MSTTIRPATRIELFRARLASSLTLASAVGIAALLVFISIGRPPVGRLTHSCPLKSGRNDTRPVTPEILLPVKLPTPATGRVSAC